MLRKTLVLAALLLIPAMARAQSAHGPFELELSGSGANGPNFNGFDASGNASIGYFFGDVLEVSFRQSATYSDLAGVAWMGSSRVAIDLHIPLGDQAQFLPFVGANGGYNYGAIGNQDQWEIAPEAGLKVFVNGTTFVFVQAEYQFNVDQHSTGVNTLGGQFRQGEFVYTAGVGFRF